LRYINQFTRELPADAVSDSKRVSDNNLSVPSTQPGSWLGEWTELKIKEHSGKQVVQVVESMFAMALRRDLGDLLYYRGKGNLALGDYDLAGLDFLRSAVEFPAGQYAPIALYSAAESAESAGKSEYAKNIYREFIDLYSHVTDHQIIALIQTARKKINVKENEP
jgi:tetratricopeptide (TPR) repeat protein